MTTTDVPSHDIIAPPDCPVSPADPCGDGDCPACGTDLYHRAVYRMLRNLNRQSQPTRQPDGTLPADTTDAYHIGQTEIMHQLLEVGDVIRRATG